MAEILKYKHLPYKAKYLITGSNVNSEKTKSTSISLQIDPEY
jgi:hypothetical protein